MAKHYPGPWIDGKTYDSIIAPNTKPGRYETQDYLDFYGGVVVAESVSPFNKPLIKAAPEMFELLSGIRDQTMGSFGRPFNYDEWLQKVKLLIEKIDREEG